MTREVAMGRGQCDIRLQVDGEVEVTLRGDAVSIRTISGQDARDDGSECNSPLPNREVPDFRFESKEGRNDMRLLSEPSARNGFAAVVKIHDTAGAAGRYQFRLTWTMAAGDYLRNPGGVDTSPGGPQRFPGGGFSWNNAISFHGGGNGEAWLNDFGPVRLGEVKIDIDQAGKVIAWFKVGRARGFTFDGRVSTHEGNRWRADVASDDGRYRGPLYFDVDGKGNVRSLSLEAGDGRDRMQLTWERR